ncbi:MAG: hypothetical protein IID53_07895 [Proteobacteria bacterium]|nr:hypothetical protein [Pseudomonadota bacterium]
MARPTLTLATWDYDRVMPVLDGRVEVEGFDVAPVVLEPSALFPRTLRQAAFDVSELSFSSYLFQTARGDCQYVAIPVFPSRAFRHGSIYVRADAGIEEPKDLEGRLIGIPEYQMTQVVYVRGFLADEYGVDFHQLRYRRGATNFAGLKERLPLDLPDSIDIEPIPADKSTNDLITAGELDAIIAPQPPQAFVDGDPRVRQLFADVVAAERAYYQKTGIFPIMHILVVRKSLVEEHPALAPALFRAFIEAKKLAMAELDAIAEASANKITLPWFAAELAATKALMGKDFWSYGVAENAKELSDMCRYSHEQHLSARLLTVGELFVAETVEMDGG